jgi:lipopolysaccharide/colanic/teichoic acid biosynthesis glycosyltransferase
MGKLSESFIGPEVGRQTAVALSLRDGFTMSVRQIYSQRQFRMRVLEEWRRAERSGRPEILVLFHGWKLTAEGQHFIELVTSTFRETDVFGWYTYGDTVGVLLVELGRHNVREALDLVKKKIEAQLLSRCNGFAAGISVELQVLPPYTFAGGPPYKEGELVESLWKDAHEDEWLLMAVTRTLDICGSLLLLLALSPVLLAIALSIRATSRGPALFCQARVGRRGRTFPMYKFRTMKPGNDDRVHREYAQQFVNGNARQHRDESGQVVYKLTNDDRVTRIGRFLRRTSLDELPQLWNVLRGEMSLVGPRPPLPYEVECYALWHRRRVYDLKPGLTGLWQVRGRSRCTFDEMTRMDLQHAHPDSLGLYFRVLLETPRAIIHGSGAH